MTPDFTNLPPTVPTFIEQQQAITSDRYIPLDKYKNLIL